MLKNNGVVLRYIREDDIADYSRWLTTETEWGDWDAPWEENNPHEFLDRQKASLSKTPEIHWKLEIDTLVGRHIGWVSSYDLTGSVEGLAVGIDIPPIEERGKGYGRDALALFMAYLFEKLGVGSLYTQTWSGNTAMVRLAEKVGFRVAERLEGVREVRGSRYDALTFSVTREEFFSKNPELSGLQVLFDDID